MHCVDGIRRGVDREVGPSAFLLVRDEPAQWVGRLPSSGPTRGPGVIGQKGYRIKRVGFVASFRLDGAEKSVLKMVGANMKDGQILLVL